MKHALSETDDTLTTGQVGFGRHVNQYLTTAIAFADAKATAFLAASLTVAAALDQLPNSGILARLAAVLLAASAIACAAGIVPRLGSARRGLIFWDDIRTYSDADDYLRAVSGLTPGRVEAEYAAQNYFVAEIAQKKHRWVRRGIWLFIAGLSSTLAAYLAG